MWQFLRHPSIIIWNKKPSYHIPQPIKRPSYVKTTKHGYALQLQHHLHSKPSVPFLIYEKFLRQNFTTKPFSKKSHKNIILQQFDPVFNTLQRKEFKIESENKGRKKRMKKGLFEKEWKGFFESSRFRR